MKHFDYADEKISEREIMIAMPSMVVGVGILTLPRNLATGTSASDGVVSLVIGGIIAILLTWLVAKLAAGFPNQSFISYTSLIVTKPVAIVLTFIFAVISAMIAAIQVREIAAISKQYLFDRTPIEVIALVFFLVVVYAVCGSRAGLFRLNMMFFPIVFFVVVIVLVVFNLRWFEMGNLLPVFETRFSGYVKGVGTSVTSLIGFGILWFYMVLVKQPKKAPKMAVIGMTIPIVFYVFLFIICIGVFGNSVTSNLLYPAVELAKEVELPGEFFERFESIFFVIWIMTIFNTAALGLDVAVFALTSIFKNRTKRTIVLIISPVVYFIAMFPQELTQVAAFEKTVSYIAVSLTIFVIILLSVVAKLRSVKRVD